MAEKISEHALIRYIERVRGESLDQYRRELEAILDQTVKWRRDLPPGGIPGFVLVVEFGTLVTILPPRSRGQKNKSGFTRYAALATPEAGQ